MDYTESKQAKCIDWAVALWTVFAGALFLVPLFGIMNGSRLFARLAVELWALGNYVYMVVLVVMLTALALGVVRRFNRK